MGRFWKAYRAEFLKMRRTFLYGIHAAVPLAGSLLFLLYYRMSAWDELAQLSGFAEIIGVSFPLLAALVCAGTVSLEEENHFQVFLGNSCRKRDAFLAKWLAMESLGFLAVLAAILLFAAGQRWWLGKDGISPELYGGTFLLLFLGSVPLYLEHLFLNLMFPKNVSLGIGVAQLVLSALFLTGLGEGRWQFFPCAWSAREAALFLAYASRGELEGFPDAQMRGSAVICLLLTLGIYAIIRIWFYFYEGRQCND